ncbi:hypothetical protein EMCRGX_G004454 [Ephydatia muelleri]
MMQFSAVVVVPLAQATHFSGYETKCSLRNTVQEEYDAWLRLSDVMASLDPLEWWKIHCTQFPTIGKLARKYLAIPASSAPSERVFSRAKLIQDRQRWSLLPQRLEASIMLKHNAWMLRKK